MLQNRYIRIVFICAIIVKLSEQAQQQHQTQQGQGRRINVAVAPQTRQLPLEPRLAAERTQKAKEVLKYMNLTADACTDFYEYACGNWLQYQNTDLTKEGELISVQIQMEANVNKQLQAILSEPIASSQDTTGIQIIKDFYRTCLRVAATSPNQKQFIQSFVLQHGGLPDIKGSQWQSNYNWIQVIAELRNKYGLDILIGLTIDKKPNSNANTIYIEEPQTSLLPMELCSALATQEINEKDEVFNQIQYDIKENLQNWFDLSNSDSQRIAGSIIRFEFDLCKYMRKHQIATILSSEQEQEDLNSRQGHYNARFVENKMHGVRQNYANNPQNLDKLSQQYEIDFKYFVDHSLGTETISQVYFRSEEYFQQLAIIAKKGLQAAFANYIMYRALAEINFPANERRNQRPTLCVQKVQRYFPQFLGKLYNDKFYRNEVTQDLNNIFMLLKDTFANRNLDNAQWIMDNTKKAIKRKLYTINLNYPSYPQTVGIIRGGLQGFNANLDYWQKLNMIMMYSANQTIQQLQYPPNIQSNYIESPAVSLQQKPYTSELLTGFGLLQKPFYSLTYSNSLKYSSIGLAIAREMVKVVDDQGWHENPMSVNPWDYNTKDNALNNTECFRSTISNYFYDNPYKYRNASKLREAMALSSALNISFNAYLSWLEQPVRSREELELETLPNLNFTNTQLFFINFAQTHCAARYMSELPPEYFPLIRHTVERFDINGPISNNEEFSRDFGCPIGSNMNLHDKCLAY